MRALVSRLAVLLAVVIVLGVLAVESGVITRSQVEAATGVQWPTGPDRQDRQERRQSDREPRATPEGPRAGLGAPTALQRLDVASPANGDTYDRDRFGYDWADLDGDGCRTRDEMLARDLTQVRTSDGCNVVNGVLADPYTGTDVIYDEAESALTVQIDHLYPLSLAWQHGANEWTDEKRLAFANDPANLIASDGPTNASKGDSGPGEWTPPNRSYGCTYGRAYAQVAYAYDLTIGEDDRVALSGLLSRC